MNAITHASIGLGALLLAGAASAQTSTATIGTLSLGQKLDEDQEALQAARAAFRQDYMDLSEEAGPIADVAEDKTDIAAAREVVELDEATVRQDEAAINEALLPDRLAVEQDRLALLQEEARLAADQKAGNSVAVAQDQANIMADRTALKQAVLALQQERATIGLPEQEPSPANPGAFAKLSPGEQAIARALFHSQRSGLGDDRLTLNEIAAMKESGTGWGKVFHEMREDGLTRETNLGDVISDYRHASFPDDGRNGVSTIGRASVHHRGELEITSGLGEVQSVGRVAAANRGNVSRSANMGNGRSTAAATSTLHGESVIADGEGGLGHLNAHHGHGHD